MPTLITHLTDDALPAGDRRATISIAWIGREVSLNHSARANTKEIHPSTEGRYPEIRGAVEMDEARLSWFLLCKEDRSRAVTGIPKSGRDTE